MEGVELCLWQFASQSQIQAKTSTPGFSKQGEKHLVSYLLPQILPLACLTFTHILITPARKFREAGPGFLTKDFQDSRWALRAFISRISLRTVEQQIRKSLHGQLPAL